MNDNSWIETIKSSPLLIGTLGIIIGAFLNKFIPFIWTHLANFSTWILRKFGGRLAFRHLEKQLMNWTVIQLRELKLTGIITSDHAKKPKLEQVFVSLRVVENGDKGKFISPGENLLEHLRSPDSFYGHGHHDSIREAIAIMDVEELEKVESALSRKIKSLDHRELLIGLSWSSKVPHILSCLIFLLRDKVSSIKKGRITRGHLVRRILWIARALERAVALNDPDPNAALLKKVLRHNQRMAILGTPGAGKTTLLQYVALAYARERAGDPTLRRRNFSRRQLGATKWRLPLFIPLGTAAPLLTKLNDQQKAASLLEVLPQLLDPELRREYGAIAPAYFQSRLNRGECAVLLDGLDEVPSDNDFEIVVQAIESLAVRFPNNQFIVTSRIAGWRSGVEADFRKYYVEDLNDDQVKTFVQSWYSSVERNAVVGDLRSEGQAEKSARERRASLHAEELKIALQRNEGIRRLASNPMLLSIIAMVHRSLATLPRERAKLYGQCTRILLEQWDISRGLRVDDTGLKLEQKEAIMRRLALAMHRGEIGEAGGTREAPREQVQKVITSLLPSMGRSPEDAAPLLQRLMERSGLITERRRDILGFAHLTFQEYFAAQGLSSESAAKSVSFLVTPQTLFNDWWREVLLLYSGLQADSSRLIAAILKNAEIDLKEARLHLAGLCFLESVQIKDEKVRSRLESLLLARRTSGLFPTTQRAPLPPNILEYLALWLRDNHSADPANSSSSHISQKRGKLINSRPHRLMASIAADLGKEANADTLHEAIKHLLFLPKESMQAEFQAVTEAISQEMRPAWVSLLLELTSHSSRNVREVALVTLIGATETPTPDLIDVMIKESRTLDFDAASTVEDVIKSWHARGDSMAEQHFNLLFNSGHADKIQNALTLWELLIAPQPNPHRLEDIVRLLGDRRSAVARSASRALRKTSDHSRLAWLLISNVDTSALTVAAALDVAVNISWSLDSAALKSLEGSAHSDSDSALIACSILVQPATAALKQLAVNKLINAATERVSVSEELLRAAVKGNRGDVTSESIEQLIRLVKRGGRLTPIAAKCLGELTPCPSATASSELLLELAIRPKSFKERLQSRTMPLLSIDGDGTSIYSSREFAPARVQFALDGLVSLGRDCGITNISHSLAGFIRSNAPLFDRIEAAAALGRLPPGEKVDEIYRAISEFFRTRENLAVIEAIDYRFQFQVALHTHDFSGFAPDVQLHHPNLLSRHPLVHLARLLDAESLEKNILLLMSSPSIFPKVCASLILQESACPFTPLLHEAMVQLIRTSDEDVVLIAFLHAADTLLKRATIPSVFAAVQSHLTSPSQAIREIAWAITADHYFPYPVPAN